MMSWEAVFQHQTLDGMGIGRESVESHRVVEVNANGWPRFQNKLLWCSRYKELVNRIDLCNSTAMIKHKRFKSGTALRESFEKRVDIITLQHLEMLKALQRNKSTQWLSCICKAHAVEA